MTSEKRGKYPGEISRTTMLEIENCFEAFFQLEDIYRISDGPKSAGKTFEMTSKNYKITAFDLALEHTYE